METAPGLGPSLWQRCADHFSGGKLHLAAVLADREQLGLDDVRGADEVGDETVGRMVIDLPRRTNLKNIALAHDGDVVRHGQRFFLVMGDEDEGDAGFVLQPLQLDLHFLSELQIERGEWLVEQQHLWMRRKATRQRHPLLLTARELRNLTVLHRLELHQLKHLADGALDLVLGLSQHQETKADVLRHRHMRKERVALKHGVDRTLIRRQQRDILAMQQDLAGRRMVKAGDQPEQGGLAAAGRAEQCEELVLPNGHRNLVQRHDLIGPLTKNLGHTACVDGGSLFSAGRHNSVVDRLPIGHDDSFRFVRSPAGKSALACLWLRRWCHIVVVSASGVEATIRPPGHHAS